MAGGRFNKQADWYSAKLNANYYDSVAGGALTTAPSGLVASQGQATLPGDRIILSPSDAFIQQNNTTQKLYTGTYRYVNVNANSSSDPTRGHAAFWVDATGANNQTLDGQYQVQSDEAANFGVVQMAGVFINNINVPNNNNSGNNFYWWIQESGKATLAFRNAISGTPAIGAGVYLAAAANNNNAIDVGAFDQIFGQNQTTIFAANGTAGYNAIDAALVRYVGPALTLPANNNTAVVDLTLARASFRW